MAKFRVEWGLSARGYWDVEAESAERAEEIVGEIETDDLLATVDRFDFSTYPDEL